MVAQRPEAVPLEGLIGPGDLLGEIFGHVGMNEMAAEADSLEAGSEQAHQDVIAVRVVVDLDVDRLAGRVGRAGLAALGRVVLFAAAGAIDLERHAGELAGEVQPLDQIRIDAIEPAAAFAGPGLFGKIVLHLPLPPVIISTSLLAMPRRSAERPIDQMDITDPQATGGLTDIQRAARYYYLQRLCFGGRVRGRTF